MTVSFKNSLTLFFLSIWTSNNFYEILARNFFQQILLETEFDNFSVLNKSHSQIPQFPPLITANVTSRKEIPIYFYPQKNFSFIPKTTFPLLFSGSSYYCLDIFPSGAFWPFILFFSKDKSTQRRKKIGKTSLLGKYSSS